MKRRYFSAEGGFKLYFFRDLLEPAQLPQVAHIKVASVEAGTGSRSCLEI